MDNFSDLLHESVLLKNGKEGVVVGFWQEKKELPMQYAVQFWNDNGKQTEYYYSEDFSMKGIV